MPEVRTIDANALKKDLSEFNYEMAMRIVDTQPTIEPEVRHGQWFFVGEETMHDGWTYRKHKCSECGFSTVEAINFCPNCGSMNRGV